MKLNVFFEMELILLVIFSVFIPVGIYLFLYKKIAISRWTVVAFALLLVVVAGIDVILLQSLTEKAKATESLLHDRLFSGQLSLILYLLPAAFAGLGVNLLSHVLVNHLNDAEKEFDREHREFGRHGVVNPSHWLQEVSRSEGQPEPFVLMGAAVSVAAIFVLDLLTGTDIRLHVLYIFPLAIVARYCPRLKMVITALVVTSILQVITFSQDAQSILSFATDVFVAISASLLTMFLARKGRNAYLLAVNQAATDPLTCLPNRRAFMAEVGSEIARQKRYGGFFSLAVLDLDGFKKLNDAQGHAAGDEALKLAAEVLRSCTRESDSIGRIGGDEFAVLLPNTQDVDCAYMFHQLCISIATRMAATGFSITASIGCKTFQTSPESLSAALQQADEIMYEAKKRGKNQAVHA